MTSVNHESNLLSSSKGSNKHESQKILAQKPTRNVSTFNTNKRDKQEMKTNKKISLQQGNAFACTYTQFKLETCCGGC